MTLRGVIVHRTATLHKLFLFLPPTVAKLSRIWVIERSYISRKRCDASSPGATLVHRNKCIPHTLTGYGEIQAEGWSPFFLCNVHRQHLLVYHGREKKKSCKEKGVTGEAPANTIHCLRCVYFRDRRNILDSVTTAYTWTTRRCEGLIKINCFSLISTLPITCIT